MSIPNSPAVWIVLIAVAAVVVVWAIAKGRGISFQRGKVKVSVSGEPEKPADVTVGEGLHAEGGKMGSVTGIRADAGSRPPLGTVSVFDQAQLNNQEVGDITGVDLSGKNSGQKK
jgi:hypothetical protein